MTDGDIAMGWIQQSDGRFKRRPVVVLRRFPGRGDFLICGISTRLHEEVAGFDIVIRRDDPAFALTRLREDSVIRLTHVGTIAARDLEGRVGRLDAQLLGVLRERLAAFVRGAER
jgi:mRNA interferase MazF